MRAARACAAFAVVAVFVAASPGPVVSDFKVRETFRSIYVDTRAPYPPEIENETQARALAKEAAVVLAQNEILLHILKKRTRSGKTLAEAKVPSTEIQNDIRALIQGARVASTRFEDDECRVRLIVLKKNLKVILRKG